ncbi:hypothetical protein Tco_1062356 [Tanacetum coccineum]
MLFSVSHIVDLDLFKLAIVLQKANQILYTGPTLLQGEMTTYFFTEADYENLHQFNIEVMFLYRRNFQNIGKLLEISESYQANTSVPRNSEVQIMDMGRKTMFRMVCVCDMKQKRFMAMKNLKSLSSRYWNGLSKW